MKIYFTNIFNIITSEAGVRCGAVSLGTELQAGRSLVQFPLGSLGFFINLIRTTSMGLGSTQPLAEMSTRGIFWGVKAAGA
jgi:hypothetical protein